MCVFSLVCQCVSTCVFFFLQGSGVLKEAGQLPFTAPGGNKQ